MKKKYLLNKLFALCFIYCIVWPEFWCSNWITSDYIFPINSEIYQIFFKRKWISFKFNRFASKMREFDYADFQTHSHRIAFRAARVMLQMKDSTNLWASLISFEYGTSALQLNKSHLHRLKRVYCARFSRARRTQLFYSLFPSLHCVSLSLHDFCILFLAWFLASNAF